MNHVRAADTPVKAATTAATPTRAAANKLAVPQQHAAELPPAQPPPLPRRSSRANKGKHSARLIESINFLTEVEAEEGDDTALIVHDILTNGKFTPSTYEEAITCEDSEHWQDAMQDEMTSLLDNCTWQYVKLPPGRRAIRNRWVFKIKIGPDGEVLRYKARLVAKGFEQRYGWDYHHCFSPVVRMDSVRLLLSIAAQLKLLLFQFDFKTAFLNGTLGDVDIFMQQPEGFKVGSGVCCKLLKTLYGLKQAWREWNNCLNDSLSAFGFFRCESDRCIYVMQKDDTFALLAIWVDDVLLACTHPDFKSSLLVHLRKDFEVSDLGTPEWFLGCRIDYECGMITMSQALYIEKVLQRFNMSTCKPAATPADSSSKLHAIDKSEKACDVPYREAVGALLYIALCTRPDIAYAVASVARHCARPGQRHWVAVKRIMRYLSGTRSLGIKYQHHGAETVLHGYTDADYAGEIDSRRSTTGYVFFLAGGPITWKCQLQKTVALSTSEAEYLSLSSSTQEVLWLRQLMNELTLCQENPTVVFEDNDSCIKLSDNPYGHQRTKHIDVRHHFIRRAKTDGHLHVAPIATDEQTADVLTKALPREAFTRHRQSLVSEV